MDTNYEFIKFRKSNKPEKKYTAVLKNKSTGREKNVHFGSSKYEHYKDSTGLGKWSHKDHNDANRRKRFRQRFNRLKNKKWTPAFFSWNYLW